MPSIQRSALVAYSAGAMFDLVNDVAAYPQFLPGCADSQVLDHSESHMKASLLVSKAGIKQWFTTLNTLEPARRIDMRLVDGPFKQLSGGWTFSPLSDDACKIAMRLHVAYSSKMLSLLW